MNNKWRSLISTCRQILNRAPEGIERILVFLFKQFFYYCQSSLDCNKKYYTRILLILQNGYLQHLRNLIKYNLYE